MFHSLVLNAVYTCTSQDPQEDKKKSLNFSAVAVGIFIIVVERMKKCISAVLLSHLFICQVQKSPSE